MSRISFRRARRDDIESLLRLEAHFPTDALKRRNLVYLLRRQSAEVWVADIGGQIAGELVLLFRKRSNVARIYSLAVSPMFRGQGIGRRLVSLADDRALTHQCAAIKLEVRPDNLPAIALYRRMGFESVGRLVAFYEDGTDGLSMRKMLPPVSALHSQSHNKAA